MKLHALLLFAGLNLVMPPASAAEYACPELAKAGPVNACPSEEELRYTYVGYCSDNSKIYGNQTDSCPRYEDFRAMKNTVLWESADGQFDGYLSCDLSPEKLKDVRASRMQVVKQGSLTKLVCSYPQKITLTHRTKGQCTLADNPACAADTSACRATCD
ncbi:hypothetical protein [Azonexus sp.]|uniref:hypothetical protein n=1 Tax=Azonexus sp. TaxID=1872668 RepID=UPI0039E3D0D1